MLLSTIRLVHLLSAAVWTGGMLTLAALVVALRRAGAEREHLQAAARMFARVSWTAMALAIGTGIAQVVLMRLPWTYGRLHIKLGLVALAVLIAAVHQLTAKRTSPGVRGAIQGVLLLVSIAIFAAAVALGT
ncbi:MAG: hypothetical protein KF729_09660 [Sandaracinaceae bacterium]|nr:hypothetical protein [Sandaracinaceae bacterium]